MTGFKRDKYRPICILSRQRPGHDYQKPGNPVLNGTNDGQWSS